MTQLGQHHWNWLSKVEADLAHVDPRREDEKERLLSLCDAVLEAHPQNETARVMREKVMTVFCAQQDRTSAPSEINNTSEISNITSSIEQVKQVISRNGKIVGEIPRAQAKRLLIAICQNHGDFSVILKSDTSPQRAYDFLRHQMSIIHMFDNIRAVIGKEKLHFFPEGLRADSDDVKLSLFHFVQNMPPARYREREANIRQNSAHPEAAAAFFRWLKQQVACDQEQAMYQMNHLAAETRVTCDMFSDPKNLDYVHGIAENATDMDLLQDFRNNTFQKLRAVYDEETASRMAMEWLDQFTQDRLRRMHPFIAERLHNKLPQGKAGIMTLGARHFSSGSYAQSNLVDFSIEKYLLEKPELNDMHVLIVEPDYLPSTNEEE